MRRVPEVPAAVGALALLEEPDRLRACAPIGRRQRLDREQHARRRLDERPGVDRPSPRRTASGSGAFGSGSPRCSIANASARRARAAIVERERGERARRRARRAAVQLVEPAIGRWRAASHRARGRHEGERGNGGRLDLGRPADTRREAAVGPAKAVERANERVWSACASTVVTWCRSSTAIDRPDLGCRSSSRGLARTRPSGSTSSSAAKHHP